MPRRSPLTLGPVLLTVLGVLVAPDRLEGAAIALFPIQNRAGDSAAAAVVDQTLRFEISNHGPVLGPEPTRNVLRRYRVRNGDRGSPAVLRQLSEELGADWLVSCTLHDADRRLVPRVTLSARVYSGSTGELVWAGFQGGSGIDRRKVLGLGTIEDLESLIPIVVTRLFADLTTVNGQETADSRSHGPLGVDVGSLAIVPFAGSTRRRATSNAEAVTEATRARFFQLGIDLVSPNLSQGIIRRQQSGQWGGVTANTREELRSVGGADLILTGAVETYEVGGSEFEPEPKVAIALRLLDAESGRILWTGSMEREGWDRQGLLGLGRVHSLGALTGKMLEILTKRLLRDIANGSPG